MFDPTKLGYTYSVNQDGTVNLTAACNGVLQPNLGGIDVTSDQTIQAYFANYIPAYITGLIQTQPVTPGPDVAIDTPITVGD